MILTIHLLYLLIGAILAVTALMTLADRGHPKRYSSAGFWGFYALVSSSATCCHRSGSGSASSSWR